MTAGPVTGIAFDLDGTLVNSGADIAGAINAMLATHGIQAQPVGYVEQFIGEGTRNLVAGVYRGMGIEVSGERLDEDTRTYLQSYAENPVVHSTLYADARAGLTALAQRGVALGVCTNKTQHMAEAVLTGLGLRDLFAAVVGADAVAASKPAPEHLLTALEQMGTPMDQALFVGDTDVDVECARRAGVPLVLVDWAPARVEPQAARRIRRFAELGDLLDARTSPNVRPGRPGATHP
ncbi:HAD family hydrolase [Blastococcus sp. SYSU DS0617]